jgi:hypothetical protein
MTGALETPVTVILFNRPDRVRDLIDVLRVVRPRHVLAVADGPRPGHPTDADLCAAARDALAGIDWPCRVEREFAASNLGCDRRIPSGLAWVFSRVDRTIILEDDLVPSVDFFAWMERMLDAHATDEQVAMVSGRNPLGQWGPADCDHLRAVRGSNWGWATWSRAWHRVNAVDLASNRASDWDGTGRIAQDPVVAEHLDVYLQLWSLGSLAACDIVWGLKCVLAGMAAVVSPTNLVRNAGFGPDATHTHHVDPLAAALPVLPARLLDAPCPASAEAATSLDRASVLVELLGRCMRPAMAARLARSAHAGTALPIDRRMRHHLLPFRHAAESLAALDHLVAQGLDPGGVEELRDALQGLVRRGGAS